MTETVKMQEAIEYDALNNRCKCPVCGEMHWRPNTEAVFFCHNCHALLFCRAFTETELAVADIRRKQLIDSNVKAKAD